MVGYPLVSVVVPAFNAEKTIDDTVQSVRAQTYGNLEILVVDDGSVDRTIGIVEAHARTDRRVRLIRQSNQGPSAARNRAIDEARGEFIAPVDADDLWRPTKVQKQLDAMLAGGSLIGLVYTWQATIDRKNRIVSAPNRSRPDEEGHVFARLFLGNFVGGSSALIRKEAIVEAGGYDTSLRAAEDLKLYLQIAERYQFAVVRECLTGYRQPGGLSNDVVRMVRSRDVIHAEFRHTYPEFEQVIRKASVLARRRALEMALLTLQFRSAGILAAELFRKPSADGLFSLAVAPAGAVHRVLERAMAMLKGAVYGGASSWDAGSSA